MDYEQFIEKFEEMETQMGPLSAYTNYQLQTAITWGFLWSLTYVPTQVNKFVEYLMDSSDNHFINQFVLALIYITLIVIASVIFHIEVKKLNHQFLEQNSILEVMIIYLVPFCPLCVVFYVTIFEMLLRTCREYINIIFIWISTSVMTIIYYAKSHEINNYLFFLNIIAMDTFSILIGNDNGKIISPMNKKSYTLFAIGIFLAYYAFYWIFAIDLILHLFSFLLYILNVILIYIHLQRKVYPLFGNTPINIFILNKIIPFTINIIISYRSFSYYFN